VTREGECGIAIRGRITKVGLLTPREVAERVFGEGSEELEISEEPGRLLISPVRRAGESRKGRTDDGGAPILALGEDPVEDAGGTDASLNHDRYLYAGG
jgi:hypothetical protein